jgi:hypothetical protein
MTVNNCSYTSEKGIHMNIFFIHKCAFCAAKMQCDKHIVKMPLETCQIACTAHRYLDGDEYADKHNLYKIAHLNHPSTVWARSSKSHYEWLISHFEALLDEKLRRYPTKPPHKSGELLEALRKIPDNIPDLGFTPPPQCMPDEYKHDDTVQAYRNYYCGAKAHIATWKWPAKRPEWYVIT